MRYLRLKKRHKFPNRLVNFVFGCKTKILIARGRVVKIYDFWPDRDLEVTEDIESGESEEDEDESYSEASNDIDWDSLNEESFDEDHDQD